MVFGHEVANLSVYALIFSFHMPLFFILSGYTSRPVQTWARLKAKVKSVFIKCWLLAVIMVLLLGLETWAIQPKFNFRAFYTSVLGGIYWGSNLPWLHSVGIMWFLFVFFWAKVFFDLLQVLLKNKTLLIGIVLLILQGISMYYCNNFRHWLPQALDIMPIASTFMWIGQAAKQLINNKNVPKWALIATTCFLIIFWAFCVYHKVYIELATRHYPYMYVTILEATGGTIIACAFSKWLAKFKVSHSIQIIGQHTLAVMCIHHLDLYWVIWDNYVHSWIIAALLRLSVDFVILTLYLLVLKKLQSRKSSNIPKVQ